jgi:hypothetical protein
MDEVPVSPFAEARFTGGIWRFGIGLGGTYPFGRLAFDETRLRIWGLGASVDVARQDVEAVRFSPMFPFGTAVSVVLLDDSESRVYFAALSSEPIRAALRARGWSIFEDRSRGRFRPRSSG